MFIVKYLIGFGLNLILTIKVNYNAKRFLLKIPRKIVYYILYFYIIGFLTFYFTLIFK